MRCVLLLMKDMKGEMREREMHDFCAVLSPREWRAFFVALKQFESWRTRARQSSEELHFTTNVITTSNILLISHLITTNITMVDRSNA